MDPDLAGFIGLAVLMTALVAWLRADMNGRMDRLDERLSRIEAMQAEQGERLARVETVQAEQGERLTRIETVQAEQGERLTRIEAAQAEQGATLSAHGERLTRIEATLSEHGAVLSGHGATLSAHSEPLTRIETAQNELRKRMEGMETGQHAVRNELAHTNERMARIEGTVAGALGRPFPELMARAPDVAAAE